MRWMSSRRSLISREIKYGASVPRVLGVVFAAFLFEGVVTTLLVSLIAESPVNIIHVLFVSTFNVFSLPLLIGFGIGFPLWVWAFIVTAWISQLFIVGMPLRWVVRSVLRSIIFFMVAALGFGLGGVLFGGWSKSHAIDVVIAISFPPASAISMWVGGPFNFSAPELGVVVMGWAIIFLLMPSDG